MQLHTKETAVGLYKHDTACKMKLDPVPWPQWFEYVLRVSTDNQTNCEKMVSSLARVCALLTCSKRVEQSQTGPVAEPKYQTLLSPNMFFPMLYVKVVGRGSQHMCNDDACPHGAPTFLASASALAFFCFSVSPAFFLASRSAAFIAALAFAAAFSAAFASCKTILSAQLL